MKIEQKKFWKSEEKIQKFMDYMSDNNLNLYDCCSHYYDQDRGEIFKIENYDIENNRGIRKGIETFRWCDNPDNGTNAIVVGNRFYLCYWER